MAQTQANARGKSQMKNKSNCMMKSLVLYAVVCVFANVVPAAASPKTNEANKAGQFMPPIPQGKKWRLVWSDEFNGTNIDQSKWEILGDWRRRDGYWVKEDAYLDGKGNLILRIKKDRNRYTCGAVRTQGKFEHKFGYWVARFKFPEQQGHWPAFWLFARPGVETVGNEGRDGTEIDIMEKPWLEDKITQNLHWDGYGEKHKTAGENTTILPGLSEGYHTFGLHWKPDEYVFYVDGEETWRTSAGGISQVPQFIKLTEEVGTWGGDIKKAELPDFFVVDYVRVYETVSLVMDDFESYHSNDELREKWKDGTYGLSCYVRLAGDINGDCIVDGKDVEILTSSWLHSYAKYVYTQKDVDDLVALLEKRAGSRYYIGPGDDDFDAVLDVSSWLLGVPDGWLGPEDITYMIDHFITYGPG
jgi:beta-glucanase (GH16 family)